jgi:hypothetical protein
MRASFEFMLSKLSLSPGTDLHKAVPQKGEAAAAAFVPGRCRNIGGSAAHNGGLIVSKSYAAGLEMSCPDGALHQPRTLKFRSQYPNKLPATGQRRSEQSVGALAEGSLSYFCNFPDAKPFSGSPS